MPAMSRPFVAMRFVGAATAWIASMPGGGRNGSGRRFDAAPRLRVRHPMGRLVRTSRPVDLQLLIRYSEKKG